MRGLGMGVLFFLLLGFISGNSLAATFQESPDGSMEYSIGELTPSLIAELDALDENGFIKGLWNGDPSVFGLDQTHSASIANRLGWVHLPEKSQELITSLSELQKYAKDNKYTDALVLAMGGSSRTAELLRGIFGDRQGGLHLHVAETTNPRAIHRYRTTLPLQKTLFIVASKSGGTVEPNAGNNFFWDLVPDGKNFIAITDPGSSLEKLAETKNFAFTFLGIPDVGGRFSALSPFGLVPAALMGVDVELLLNQATAALAKSGENSSSFENPGILLGSIIGVAAKYGRDKLTLAYGSGLQSIYPWTEQLIAESIGKDGKGIIPSDFKPEVPIESYHPDRIFVYVHLNGAVDSTILEQMNQLAAAGHPVIIKNLGSVHDIGAHLYEMQMATAAMGRILHVNPFDEPDVTSAKKATMALLEKYAAEGHLGFNVRKYDPQVVAEKLAARAESGSYVGLLNWMADGQTPETEAALQELAIAIEAKWGIPVVKSTGPGYLHSIGQLYKGGPKSGEFLFLFDESSELAIPGMNFGFKTLFQAQGIGDFNAMIDRGISALSLGGIQDSANYIRTITKAIRALPVRF